MARLQDSSLTAQHTETTYVRGAAAMTKSIGVKAKKETGNNASTASVLPESKTDDPGAFFRTKAVIRIQLRTEKDLLREMTNISDGIRDSQDWSRRLTALQRIPQIVHSAATFPTFVTHLRDLNALLLGEISSLRSALVRAACGAAVEIATVLQDHFDPFAVLYVPVILKLTKSSTQVRYKEVIGSTVRPFDCCM